MNEDYALISFRDEDSGLTFRWYGGEYIDVGWVDADGEFRAEDVLNVWDHVEDMNVYEVNLINRTKVAPKVRPLRFILEQFERDCREYIERQHAEVEDDGSPPEPHHARLRKAE